MTRINNFYSIVLKFFIISLVLLGCNSSHDYSKPKNQTPKCRVETFSINEGWGYNILSGNKVIIRQDIIPGIQKNIPFKSESDAKKVGLLVLEKVKNQIHPAVKTEELDSLKINYQN